MRHTVLCLVLPLHPFYLEEGEAMKFELTGTQIVLVLVRGSVKWWSDTAMN